MISYRVPTHRTNHFVMTYGRYLCFKLDFTHFKRRKRERLQLNGTG